MVGETIAECDTLIKALVGRKSFASKSSFGCSEGELEAIREGLRAMASDGLLSGPEITTRWSLTAEEDPEGAATAQQQQAHIAGDDVSPGKPSVHQKSLGRTAEFKFIHVLEPQQLQSMSPPPKAVLLCYTPVEPATLVAVGKRWMPAVAQMLKRPDLLLVATRVESLASKKGIEWLKSQSVPKTSCEEAVDKASSWRALEYVEVSAACFVNLELLLRKLSKACFTIPGKRATPEIAEAMRKDCVQPIVSTQSTWSWKRTDKRRLYYFNRLTRASQWTRPADYDGEEPELTEAEKEAEVRASRNAIEKKMREDHERLLEEQFRNEASMHQEKMAELETLSVSLSQQVNTLTIQMEEIRRLITTNKRDREELERLKEGIEETRFSKTAVDDETRIDREIADARARVFELESRAAMHEENENYSIEIAELVLSNDLQAQTLRKLLQSQVDVRKQGAASQSKFSALAAHIDSLTGEIANTSQSIPTILHQLSAKQSDLRKWKRRLQELRDEKAALMGTIVGTDNTEHNRQVNIERLIQQSKALDVEIDRRRLEKGLINMAAAAAGGRLEFGGGRGETSASTRSTNHTPPGHHSGSRDAQMRAETQQIAEVALKEEELRLRMEERNLASQLATSAAEAALRELALRQKSHLLEYTLAEHGFSSEKYLKLFQELVETLSSVRDEVCSGSYFAVSNPIELEMLAAAIDDSITDAVHHAASGLNRRRSATTSNNNSFAASPQLKSSPSSLKGRVNATPATAVRQTTPRGSTTPRRADKSPQPLSGSSSQSLLRMNTGLFDSFGNNNSSFGLGRESSSFHGGPPGSGGGAAPRIEHFNRNDFRQMRATVALEKQRGDLANAIRAKCSSMASLFQSTRTTIEGQRLRTLGHMRDAMKAMSEIDILAGHEKTSPLERFVTLLEDSFLGGSKKVGAAEDLPAVVADIVDGFTARMLESVPVQDRGRLAMQANAPFFNNSGAGSAVSPIHPTNQTTGSDSSISFISPSHVAAPSASLVGALTSPLSVTRNVLMGPGSLEDVEKQYRFKERASEASAMQYSDIAKRAAVSLGLDAMGPTLSQQDQIARAKMKVMSRPVR